MRELSAELDKESQFSDIRRSVQDAQRALQGQAQSVQAEAKKFVDDYSIRPPSLPPLEATRPTAPAPPAATEPRP